MVCCIGDIGTVELGQVGCNYSVAYFLYGVKGVSLKKVKFFLGIGIDRKLYYGRMVGE